MAKKKKSFEEAVEKTLEEAEKQKEQNEQSGEEAEEDPAEGAEETGPEPVGEDGEPDEKKDPKDEKIAELNDKVVRQMAEFDNFRKRSEKEKHEMFASGEKAVIEAILPVVDNFERALGMAGADENKKADPFMEGMEKVYKQLMDELEKMGVKPIEAVGKEFDPNMHNAVMQVDTGEVESGFVAQEMQKGYMYHDTVLRFSMVAVQS